MEIKRQRDSERDEGARERWQQTFRRLVKREGSSVVMKGRGWRGGYSERVEYRERAEKLNLGINHAISISLPTFLAVPPPTYQRFIL